MTREEHAAKLPTTKLPLRLAEAVRNGKMSKGQAYHLLIRELERRNLSDDIAIESIDKFGWRLTSINIPQGGLTILAPDINDYESNYGDIICPQWCSWPYRKLWLLLQIVSYGMRHFNFATVAIGNALGMNSKSVYSFIKLCLKNQIIEIVEPGTPGAHEGRATIYERGYKVKDFNLYAANRGFLHSCISKCPWIRETAEQRRRMRLSFG